MQNSKFEREDGSIPEVFMCINSGSGGGVGQELIKLNVYIYLIRNKFWSSRYLGHNTHLIRKNL